MSERMPLTWDRLPPTFRTLGRWLTIVQVVGYTVSLAFVLHTTAMRPLGVAERYRGSDPATGTEAMQFPKSFAEMLTNTHTHVLAMAAIFAFSGLCVALCRRPSERARRLLIAEPFAAILVTFAAMWLMRYVDARYSWLLILSSSVMAVSFYLQAFFILRELGSSDTGDGR